MLKSPRPPTILALASSCLIALPAPKTSLAFDGVFDQGHDEINELALRFLEEPLIDQINESNHDEDEGASNNYPERHLCNCTFSLSRQYINFRYRNAIDALTAYEPDTRKAVINFGLASHGIQDFYSHFPWVDPVDEGGLALSPGHKLEAGLGWWKGPPPQC